MCGKFLEVGDWDGEDGLPLVGAEIAMWYSESMLNSEVLKQNILDMSADIRKTVTFTETLTMPE